MPVSGQTGCFLKILQAVIPEESGLLFLCVPGGGGRLVEIPGFSHRESTPKLWRAALAEAGAEVYAEAPGQPGYK